MKLSSRQMGEPQAVPLSCRFLGAVGAEMKPLSSCNVKQDSIMFHHMAPPYGLAKKDPQKTIQSRIRVDEDRTGK